MRSKGNSLALQWDRIERIQRDAWVDLFNLSPDDAESAAREVHTLLRTRANDVRKRRRAAWEAARKTAPQDSKGGLVP